MASFFDSLKDADFSQVVNYAKEQNRQQGIQQQNKWYSGSQPTSYETFGQIGKIFKEDPAAGNQIWNMFQQERRTPGNSAYFAYLEPTSRASSKLLEFGVDPSSVMNDTSFLDRLSYNGTSNTPSNPGKKAPWQEQVDYWSWQYMKGEEDTQAAEAEWDALKKDVAYRATTDPRNPSPQSVVKEIDWSKYPTLNRARNANPGQPMALNRGIDFSDDSIMGVYWAAKNGGGTGNPDADIMLSAAGEGEQWKEDPEIAAKLDSSNPETYDRYSVGCTMMNEAAYFGVPSFSETWLDDNKDILQNGTDAEKKMYLHIRDRDKETVKAEEQKAAFDKKVQSWKDRGYSADKIINEKIPELLQDPKYNLLSQMDDSINDGLTDGWGILEFTRPIGFNRKSTERDIASWWAGVENNDAAPVQISNELQDSLGIASTVFPAGINEFIRNANNVAGDATEALYNNATDNEKENFDKAPGPIENIPVTTPAPAAEEPKAEEPKAETPAVSPEEAQKAAAPAPEPTKAPAKQTNEVLNAPQMLAETIANSQAKLMPQMAEKMTNDNSQVNIDTATAVKKFERHEQEKAFFDKNKEALEAKLGDKLALLQAEEGGIELEEEVLIPVNGKNLLVDFWLDDETGEYVIDTVKDASPNAVTGQDNYYMREGMELGWTDGLTLEAIEDAAADKLAALNERQKALASAKEKNLQLTEEDKKDFESWKAYKGLSIQAGHYIDQHQDEYDAAKKLRDENDQNYDLWMSSLIGNATDAESLSPEKKDIAQGYVVAKKTTELIDAFASEDYVYVPNDTDTYESLMDMTLDYLQSGGDADDSADAAAKKFTYGAMWLTAEANNAQNVSLLENLDFAEQYAQEHGWTIRGDIKRTMDEYRLKLKHDIQSFEYASKMREPDFLEKATEMKNNERASTVFHQPQDATNAEILLYHYIRGTDFQAARAYNNDYLGPVMGARAQEAGKQFHQGLVNQGAGGAILSNLLGILSSPIEPILGLAWLGESAINGRFNGKSGLLTAAKGNEAGHAATYEAIKNGIGGIWGDIVAQGYSLVYSRMRSLVMGAAFGGLFPGAGGAAEGASRAKATFDELLHAAPMAFGAATSAMAEAANNGAEPWQVIGIGVVTFLAEDCTEAIELKHMGEALEGYASGNLSSSIASWLLGRFPEMASEAIGESLNDMFEGQFGKVILGDKSEYDERVQSILMSGKADTYEEAERIAKEDALKGYATTFIFSALGPLLDFIPASAGRVYRNIEDKRYAKYLNRIGIKTNVSDLRAVYGDIRERIENNEINIDDLNDRAYYSSLVLTGLAERSDANTRAVAMTTMLSADQAIGSVEEAAAAYVHLTDVLGEGSDSVEEVRRLVDGAKVAKTTTDGMKQGLRYAALSAQSESRKVMQSEIYQAAAPYERVGMLAEAAAKDAQNEAVLQEVSKAVHDNRVAEKMKLLMAQGEAKPSMDADKKVRQKRRVAKKANDTLQKAKAETQAKAEALQQAAAEAAETGDFNRTEEVGAMASSLEKADKVVEEYQQSSDEAAAQQAEAEQDAERVKSQSMNDIRKQAEQMVANEDMIREQARKTEEAIKAIVEAEKNQAQAEEDERTGKAQEDREDAAIEEALNKEGLPEGVARDARRDELMRQRDKVKASAVDLTQKISNTEGLIAISKFARKLGMTIDFADMPFDVRGRYVNGKIYLNRNRMVSGSLSVGQALVEAALHEITHSMENLGVYQDYRKTVIENLFGISNAGDAEQLYKDRDLDDAHREYAAMIDDIINERKTGVTKEDLDVTKAEQEIIADFARKKLNSADVVQRFVEKGIAGKMKNTLHNINQALKIYFRRQDNQAIQQWMKENEGKTEKEFWKQSEDEISKWMDNFYVQAEYLRRAERLFQKALDARAKSDIHPMSDSFSVQQIAQSVGLGMVCDDTSLKLYVPDKKGKIIGDGKNGLKEGERYSEVDGVDVRITPEMINNTPVGMLIDMGLSDEEFEGEDGKKHTQKGDARKMFADLMNLCARYKDHNLIWEIAGSEFSEAFSSLKSNSDPQYKNTVDFGTICSKTQAIIDTLSGTMLKHIADNRAWNEAHPDDQRVFSGLTRDDILKVYNITHNAGLSVPCPVCYVFSRWMGVPSMLGQMNRFQHEFVVTVKDENGKTMYDKNGDAMIDWDATQKVVDRYLFGDETSQGILEKYGGKEGITDKKNSLNQKIKKRTENLPKLNQSIIDLTKQLNNFDQENASVISDLQKEIEREDLSKSERRKLQSQINNINKQREKIEKKIATARKNVEKNIREQDQFEEQRKEIEGYNWVTQALGLQHYDKDARTYVNTIEGEGTGRHILLDRDNFRITPEEILFDLNRTGEFAGYAKNWQYRTTRGAGMGKAIMPYSGASIGDLINGNAARWQTEQNPFLTMNKEQAQKAFNAAKERVRRQNLVGGQRFQSTSDFRPEWGLDYVMSFLEMQALGGKVQMYTKVEEAIDFLGSIGVDANESIMGAGSGWHVASPEEIALANSDTEEGRELKSRMGVVDGETYVMDFSDVTGMDYNRAKANTKKYNNIQMILVGMNDIHIKLALGNEDIDFIIPWHSSGNSKDTLQQLVASVGQELKESADYTDYQTDQIKSHKEGTGKKEKTIDDRSDLEIARWNARIKILKGVANKKVNTEKPNDGGFGTVVIDGKEMSERELVYKDPWLKQLYDRFYVEGVDPDCYGVELTSDQANQIFPYEYWDKNSTRENADVNGKRFAEYCDRLGLVPRFSQFKDVPGYWKLLIDRKMYDNNVLNDDGSVKEYGKYREQNVVDVTKAQIGQLPASANAKYGDAYSEETSDAIAKSYAATIPKYDNHGQFSAYGDQTEADRELVRDAARDYQSAVERGDMQAAQEDVDFVAKLHGYTEKIFHGTTSFGFTQIDPSLGDDGISFFATDSIDTANTYAYDSGVKEIKDRLPFTEKDLTTKEGYFRNDEGVLELLDKLGIEYKADGRDQFGKPAIAVPAWDTTFNDGRHTYTNRFSTDYVGIASELYKRYLAKDNIAEAFGVKPNKHTTGVYQMYAKTEGFLEIDADGSHWDSIPFDLKGLLEKERSQNTDPDDEAIPYEFEDDLSYNEATTRQIAKYARDRGYPGVTIRNLRDNGGKTSVRGIKPSTVYIFFNPKDQVRSADLVTYDDQGVMIPLEERFSSNPDIRYSTGGDLTETDIQLNKDYFKAVESGDMEEAQKMVDNAAFSAGYTIKASHGSNAAFTRFNGGIRDEMWFGDRPDTSYDRNYTYNTYLKMNNPVEFTYYLGPDSEFNPSIVTEEGRRNGHDGAIVHFKLDPDQVNTTLQILTKFAETLPVTDSFGDNIMYLPKGKDRENLAKPGETLIEFMKRGAKENLYDWYVVYKPEQIKSSDPVTYDVDGNPIPLSERFRTDHEESWKDQDIRYSFGGDFTEADRDLVRGAAAGMVNGMVGYTASNNQIKFDNAPSDLIRENLKIIGMNYDEARQIWYDNGWRAINQETIIKAVDDGNRGIETTPPPRLVKKEQPNKQTVRNRVKEGELNQTLVDSGVLTQEEVDAYNSTWTPIEGLTEAENEMLYNALPKNGQVGNGQRQWGLKGAQDSDELVKQAKDYVLANNAYMKDTNAAQLDRALNWIVSNRDENDTLGYYNSLRKVTSKNFNHHSADGQARMVAMMGMAVAQNDLYAQIQLADAFNRQGTNAGQALQARKLFKLMTPAGRISTLLKIQDDINEDYAQKGKETRVKLSDWILQAAANARDEQDMEKVREAASAEIAEQMPADWKSALRSFRMMAMLLNPRTHIRNIIGNALFVPTVGLKNKMAATIERGMQEKTKTLSFALPKEIRDFARQDAVDQKGVLTGEAKFNETSQVERMRNEFGHGKVAKFLKGLSDLNSAALEGEDWFFLKGHYRRALGGWIQANGYTVEQLKKNPELLNMGREYAVNEAQKATYRDYNEIAKRLNDFARDPKSFGGKVGALAVEAVLPFKKTPINILRRGIEYSPIGIAKSLTTDRIHLKQYLDYQKGKLSELPSTAITPNQFVDNLCSGLTGTMITIMGGLLSSAGVISVGLDGDEDEFDKLEGAQAYAIRPGKLLNMITGVFGVKLFDEDVTYTLDWAAPICMPLFTGAMMHETFKDGFDPTKFASSMLSITEPLYNLSMLEGVGSVFKTSQNEDTNMVTQLFVKMGTNYLSSYVPSVLGAMARTKDPMRRKAYVPSGQGSGPMGTINYSIEQMENKIPWLSETNIPVRDVYGRAKETTEAGRAFENFLSPGYTSRVSKDAATEEQRRLFKTGESGMVPKLPNKTFTANGEKYALSAEEYDRLTMDRGQTAYNLINDLMKTNYYQNADDPLKASMIRDVWTYATQNANYNINSGANVDNWVLGSRANPIQGIINRAKDKDEKDTIDFLKSKAAQAVQDNDRTALDTCLEGLSEYDTKNSNAAKKAKSAVESVFKPQYIRAYQENDKVKRLEIEEKLENSGLGFSDDDYEEWISKSEEYAEGDDYDSSSGGGGGAPGAMPSRPSSDNGWDQYMADLDDYWAGYDFDSNDPTEQNYGGTIDLNNRQVVHNDDDSISTEYSFSFYDEDAGKEVLIPQVVDGRIVSEEEAIDHYYETGEHLGMFDDWRDADEYAMMLHNRNNWYYNR